MYDNKIVSLHSSSLQFLAISGETRMKLVRRCSHDDDEILREMKIRKGESTTSDISNDVCKSYVTEMKCDTIANYCQDKTNFAALKKFREKFIFIKIIFEVDKKLLYCVVWALASIFDTIKILSRWSNVRYTRHIRI